jgi:hypothetical protein
MNSEIEFREELRSQMHSAANGCVAPADFGAHFVPHWFWRISRAYCFVFKKNLRITNIQVAELFSLVRSHVHSTVIDSDLRFSSIPAFDKQLSRFMETFGSDVPNIEESLNSGAEKIVNSYADYFANLALIDLHFGSCILSIPPLYSIDLEGICYLSGYIHSCGPCIYARDIYHSRYDRFLRHLSSYINTIKQRSMPILFRPYSHEDFTKHDRDQEDDLASGLDELKLYSTKQYVGDFVVAAMVEKLRQEDSLTGKLIVAKPGHSGLDKRLVGHVDPNRTFWLIIDRPLVPFDEKHPVSFAVSQYPGNRHTLICYDQELLNENPFHVFDENKPGWYDHTTIPHTLMGAMINITRPYWPSGRPVKLCDPFSGGGTAWLESCKFNEVDFTGFDIEPLSKVVSSDNIAFFSQPLNDLIKIHSSIKKAWDNYVTPPKELDEVEEWNNSPEKKLLDWAENELTHLLGQCGVDNMVFSTEAIQRLRAAEVPPLGRLLFYTMLKGQRRFSAALQTGQITRNEVVAKELDRLRKQIGRFMAIRTRLSKEPLESHGSRAVFLGKYSKACTLSPSWLGGKGDNCPLSTRAIDEMSEEGIYDVIVTDPPYGFNTHENIEKLMVVYKQGLENIIRALAPNGQLVIALPDWSHTGRRIPAFAFKEFVIYNVLQMAKRQKREAYQASAHLPRLSVNTLPPYYWESERALRRAILHFRFRPQAGMA